MASSSSKTAAGSDKLNDDFDISPGGSRHIDTSNNADRVYTLSGFRTDPRQVPPLHDEFNPSDVYEVRPKWLIEEQRQQAAKANEFLNTLFEQQLEDWRVVLKERERAALGATVVLGGQAWQLDLCVNNVIRQIMRTIESGCVFVVRQQTNEVLTCNHPMCPLIIDKVIAPEGSDYVKLEPCDGWHNLESADPIIVDDDEILVFRRPSHSLADVHFIKPKTDSLVFCVGCLRNLYSRDFSTLAGYPRSDFQLAPSTKDTPLPQQGSTAFNIFPSNRTRHHLARHSTSVINTTTLSDDMLPHKRTESEAGLDQLDDRQTRTYQELIAQSDDHIDTVLTSTSSTIDGSTLEQLNQTDGARDVTPIIRDNPLQLDTSELTASNHSPQQHEATSGWTTTNEPPQTTNGLTTTNQVPLPDLGLNRHDSFFTATTDKQDDDDEADGDDSSSCSSPYRLSYSPPISHDPILSKFLLSSWPLSSSSSSNNNTNQATQTKKHIRIHNPPTYHPDPSPTLPPIIGTAPPTSPNSLARRSADITRTVVAINRVAAREARNPRDTTLRKADIVNYRKQPLSAPTPEPPPPAAPVRPPASGIPASLRPLRLPVQICHICNEPHGRRKLVACAGPKCLSGRVHTRCAAPGRICAPVGWLCAACIPDTKTFAEKVQARKVVPVVMEEEVEEVEDYGLSVAKKDAKKKEGGGGEFDLRLVDEYKFCMGPAWDKSHLSLPITLPPKLVADILTLPSPTPSPPSSPQPEDPSPNNQSLNEQSPAEHSSPSSSTTSTPNTTETLSETTSYPRDTSTSTDSETEAETVIAAQARRPFVRQSSNSSTSRSSGATTSRSMASQLKPGSACTACRRARKRCDRARPRCAACVRKNEVCVYLRSG